MVDFTQNLEYVFSVKDIGRKKIVAKIKDTEIFDTCYINILGPNLRSTEENDSHLYFRTSNGKLLAVKEG